VLLLLIYPVFRIYDGSSLRWLAAILVFFLSAAPAAPAAFSATQRGLSTLIVTFLLIVPTISVTTVIR